MKLKKNVEDGKYKSAAEAEKDFVKMLEAAMYRIDMKNGKAVSIKDSLNTELFEINNRQIANAEGPFSLAEQFGLLRKNDFRYGIAKVGSDKRVSNDAQQSLKESVANATLAHYFGMEEMNVNRS